MKTFVKFCGLTTSDTVAMVPEGGAAGFVIDVPASPRTLSVEDAAPLAEKVPSGAEVWAVVVDPSADTIHRLFEEFGADRVQVYGSIPTDLEFLEVHHLVPSMPIPAPGSGLPVPPVPAAEDFPRVHMDAAGQALPGGSGTQADWDVCAQLVDANPGRKFVLAGGLAPENVAQALAAVRPWGVDVSSGIERSPGVKDPDRMRAFLDAVAAYESAHA